MKCPICGKEFSEPIMPFHLERCKKEVKKENDNSKKIEKMNKEELLAKANELGIVIDEEATKAQIIEKIKEKETPQE